MPFEMDVSGCQVLDPFKTNPSAVCDDTTDRVRHLPDLAWHTAQGPREALEDAAGALVVMPAIPPSEGAMLLVCCDGVGGHRGGAVASALGLHTIMASLAADLAATMFLPLPERPLDAVRCAIARALERANGVILARAAAASWWKQMSSTATCAVINNGLVEVGWVGDSRAYVFRAGWLRRLTHDHRAADELVAAGLLAPDEVAHHPSAHTVTQWLGRARGFAPSFARTPVQAGDIVLLCTDGLTDVLPDAELVHLLLADARDAAAFRELPRTLVDRALRAGADDNVTAVCVRVVTPPAAREELQDFTWTDGYPTTLAELSRSLRGDHQHDTEDTTLTRF